MGLPAIYTDADNTLWDTNAVFQAAQLALLEDMEAVAEQATPTPDRLAFVRDYDQAIASLHHERLGYAPDLLAHALVLGLRGIPHAEAAQKVIRSGHLPGTECGVNRFVAMLKALPPLLPGVAEGVRLAARHGLTLYVVTESRRDKATERLKKHALFESTTRVLSATKTIALYARLKALAGDGSVAMIGDQLDRDIVLAHEAGLLTVWIPSAFRPKWNDAASSKNASFVATNFLEAIDWLLRPHSKSRGSQRTVSG